MKQFLILCLCYVLLSVSTVWAGVGIKKDKIVFKQILIQHDNDIFTFTKPGSDRYYTFGSFIGFQMVLDSDKRFNQRLFFKQEKVKKVIAGTSITQQAWMPVNNFTREVSDMDRPYAGLLAIESSLQFHFKKGMLNTSLMLGFTGKPSGAQWFQQGLHKIFNLQPTNGWDTQIPIRAFVNWNARFDYPLLQLRRFEIVSKAVSRLGNAFVDGSLQAGFRLGKFDQWSESAWFSARISRTSTNRKLEIFMDAFIYAQAVGWDATFQGHTKEAYAFQYNDINPIRWGVYFGLYISHKRFSLKYFVHHFSEESKRTLTHDYAGISTIFRF